MKSPLQSKGIIFKPFDIKDLITFFPEEILISLSEEFPPKSTTILVFLSILTILTKDLNRADKKRLQKLRKEMMKRGEDTYEIDIQLGVDE